MCSSVSLSRVCHRSARRAVSALVAPLMVLILGAGAASGDEVVVQNDGLSGGDQAAICPCFVQGEEAAVWLTAPCDGSIVAIQVFWRSLLGGAPISLEDAIVVYEGGNFPVPGNVKDELLGPALQDGGLNEFRFQDENQTIPIDIPVQAGEEFVVSLSFFNDSTITGPSILYDTDGITADANAVRTSGGGWTDAAALGVTGDWVIRVVIDCQTELVGSVCLSDGSCMDSVTEAQALAMGGVWSGPGSTCATDACVGACFIPATEACVQFEKSTCDAVGGEWQGPGTSECNTCAADLTGDGVATFPDVSAFLTLFTAGDLAADFSGNGAVDFPDVGLFLNLFAEGCP